MTYHYNPDTGKHGLCKATVGKCPLVHGSDLEDAMHNYETEMDVSVLPTAYKRIESKEYVAVLAQTPLKELNTVQLAQTLRHEAKAAGMAVEDIDAAIDLASILHAHQTRSNRGNFSKTPYIEHPLRNAVRLLRLNVKDRDIIIAAILHDTVEDGAKAFVKKFYGEDYSELKAREILREHISSKYGERVLHLVDAVTNDYIAFNEASKMTVKEKHDRYKAHVQEQITDDEGVFLVKVSDFIDNATGLYHNNTPARAEKTKKQAKKYLPVVDVFLNELESNRLPIPAEDVKRIREQLERTTERLEDILRG